MQNLKSKINNVVTASGMLSAVETSRATLTTTSLPTLLGTTTIKTTPEIKILRKHFNI